MTTISALTAQLVQHGWPRLEPHQHNDSINQPLPKGPWWCCDPGQQCITLHAQPTIAITVGYDTSSGQLLDVTAWSDAFADAFNPNHPAELMSLAIWPPGTPQQSLDSILEIAEQQLQTMANIATAN